MNKTKISELEMTFLALLALLAFTYFLARVDLGRWNTAVGLSIAGAKALLVAIFFMKLKKSTPIHWLAALAGLFWFGILMTLTFSDYLSRSWNSLPGLWPPQ